MELVKHTKLKTVEEAKEYLERLGYKDIYLWRDAPNTHYDWHTHTFDEVRLVVEGEILIGTEEGEYLLKAGDMMVVPKGTRHWAKVGPEGVSYLCGSKY